MNHFSMIVNIEFTSLVESDLDKVAHGKIQWQEVVQKVFNSFKDSLEIQKSLTNTSSQNSTNINSRELGNYKNDKVILRDGKFGPYVSVGKRNVGLSHFMKDNIIEYKDITLDLIRNYIQYPLNLGEYQNCDVMIHIGPYGKYMKYKGKNFRIPQKDKYTLEDCIRRI